MTTDAAVDWPPAPWSTVGAAGVDQRTPDIRTVVQEIVNGNDWRAGNELVILVAGASLSKANSRVAQSYDGVATAAPVAPGVPAVTNGRPGSLKPVASEAWSCCEPGGASLFVG